MKIGNGMKKVNAISILFFIFRVTRDKTQFDQTAI